MKFKVGDILRIVDHGSHTEYMESIGHPLRVIGVYSGRKDVLIKYKNLSTGKISEAYGFRFDLYKEISEEDIL